MPKFNKKQEALIEAIRNELMNEIRAEQLECEKEYALNMDAVVLWTLHSEFGFGKKRLLRFYHAVKEEHEKMQELYKMNDAYPELYHLKRLGVDIEELEKEEEK